MILQHIHLFCASLHKALQGKLWIRYEHSIQKDCLVDTDETRDQHIWRLNQHITFFVYKPSFYTKNAAL